MRTSIPVCHWEKKSQSYLRQIQKSSVAGTVVGVGARIVEYPVRLRKNPVLQTWGREVLVKIPGNNRFILGEKVVITSSEPRVSFISYLKQQQSTFFSYLKRLLEPGETYARNRPQKDSELPEKADTSMYEILPVTPLKTSGIEASALVWLEDIDRWLMLSDDTPNKTPLLFLMDHQGRITKETLIKGLKEISDMESATVSNDGTLYIASSLSTSKKGNLGKSRRLLISVKRKGNDFSLIRNADLYELLGENAVRNNNEEWAQFILKAMGERSLDMEGMFHRDGALYLGFKSPFHRGHSVILRIDRIEEMLGKKKLDDDQVSLWKKIILKTDKASNQEHISDMFHHNGTLYVTGTSSQKIGGSLWKLDENTGKMIHIARFDGLRPEGIAAGKDKDTLMISFDQGGNNPSKIAAVRGAL